MAPIAVNPYLNQQKGHIDRIYLDVNLALDLHLQRLSHGLKTIRQGCENKQRRSVRDLVILRL
jgi:hypothetical protein